MNLLAITISELTPWVLSVGGTLGGLGALGWGIISGFRKRAAIAADALEKAQGELLQVKSLEAEAWEKRYEGEHAEYVDYRQKQQLQNKDEHELLLKLTKENAELKNKTDLSPVLQFQKDQAEFQKQQLDILQQVVGANAKIVQTLDAILVRLGIPAPLPPLV